MEIRKGIAVSPGIVIGEVFVLDSAEARIPKREIRPAEVNAEIARLKKATGDAITEVRQIQAEAAQRVDVEYLAIFDVHVGFLEDPHFHQEIEQNIREEHTSAEYAVSRVMKRHIRMFLANEFLAPRVGDLYDIQKRLLRALLGEKREELHELDRPVLIVAHDLTPSETIHFDTQKVIGFATDAGGRTSHAAIMARALGIPAVVGLKTITADVAGGDTLILDGGSGTVIINPDRRTLQRFQTMQRNIQLFEQRLLRDVRDLPAETRDGFRVSLLANIEFPEEITAALERGAEGIGLYRTEYLYVQKGRVPSEQDHFAAYKQAVEQLSPKPIIIRTLDLAGDKFFQEGGTSAARNPLLGCRSIRLSFLQRDLFATQTRAILRASAFGPVKILFPMISTLGELREAKALIREVMEELDEKGIPYDRQVQVGIMVEVPSAALMADLLAAEVDFFSIGTNDLVQYCLAVDRANEKVAQLYQPAHPSVLRLIQQVIAEGRKHRIQVGMCGEMSGDLTYVPLLLGLGLKEFSVAPAVLPEVKQMIRSLSMNEAQAIVEQALQFDAAEVTLKFLEEKAKKIMPEAFMQEE